MLHGIVTACFQNIVKADQVGLNLRIGMVDRIPHTRLGNQFDNNQLFVFSKQLNNQRLVGNTAFDKEIAAAPFTLKQARYAVADSASAWNRSSH